MRYVTQIDRQFLAKCYCTKNAVVTKKLDIRSSNGLNKTSRKHKPDKSEPRFCGVSSQTTASLPPIKGKLNAGVNGAELPATKGENPVELEAPPPSSSSSTPSAELSDSLTSALRL
ncbi:tRNA (guanine-N(7)-)-methyltransferase [Striga asiatica]|uniref:tRNA (Guanine-N(7)-)-methyltransferase n=1 Tax=Striga asiatica TaxID=4170 RepID=A0A5A7QAS9_STRAF|nr:tRNA (guanine-N(7)-)-methyltransferase [Striga asiatica]